MLVFEFLVKKLFQYRCVLHCSVFIVHCSWLSAQSFVKKDSSEIVPFISKIFYSDDLDKSKELPNKLFTNHRLTLPYDSENYYGLLGTVGSTMIPMLYENNFYKNLKLGRSLSNSYFYSPTSIPYFALNKPISELDFTFFGNGNEEFRGLLSQNLSSKLNLGIGIRRTNNKGFFLQQANEHNNLYAYLVHQTNRLRTNLEFVFNEMNLRESGGYQPDIYLGGSSPSQWNAATPSLAIAKNQFKNYQINFRYRYLIYESKDNKDSLLFVPKQSSLYIDHHLQKFSERIYYSDTFNTNSRSEYGILASTTTNNTFNSLYLHTGFQSDFRLNFVHQGLKISGYNILTDNTIELGQQFAQYLSSKEYFNLGLGVDVSYLWKKDLEIIGKGYKSFLGYTEHDFYLHGELKKTFKMGTMSAWTRYAHQMPNFIYSQLYSSSLNTSYPLNTEKTLETGILFQLDKLKFSGKAQYFFINDFLAIDSNQAPIQLQNNFFQIYLRKEWAYKSLYFPTEIYFQNSLFSRGMLRQTIAFKNKLFNARNNVFFGADLWLNFNYLNAHYSTFYMQPIYTQNMGETKIYPKVDLFATFKISKVHLSLIFDNFLSSYLKTGMSYMQNHPITPSAFYLRVNWTFME